MAYSIRVLWAYFLRKGVNMDLKAAIESRKIAEGINTAELARRSGVGKQYIGELLNEKKDNPTLSILIDLANGLNMPLWKLIKLAE